MEIDYFFANVIYPFKSISNEKTFIFYFRFRLYLRLFVLAGFTWLFEVLSHQYGGSSQDGVTFW